MKILELMNKQRQSMGQITWQPPDQVRVTADDAELAAGLTALVDQARQAGLAWRGGEQVVRDGRNVFVERQVIVKPDDERFLAALADTINRAVVAGRRVFALLREQ